MDNNHLGGDYGATITNSTIDQQQRLQSLSSAFKGSISNKSSRRKPSQLTLTKRPEQREPSFLPMNVKNNETCNKQILELNERTGTPENLNMEQEGVNETSTGLEGDKILQQTLSTLNFHPHSDQSISKIDLLVCAERQWLANYPQSQTWEGIRQRIVLSKSEESTQQSRQENENVDRFINTVLLQGAGDINNLLSGADNDKERMVVRLTFNLLEECIVEVTTELCEEVLDQAVTASTVLYKSMFKALASVSLGLEGSGSRFWKMSGREQVLKGILSDGQRNISTRSRYQQINRKGSLDLHELPVIAGESDITVESSTCTFYQDYYSVIRLPCWIPEANDKGLSDEVSDFGDDEVEEGFGDDEMFFIEKVSKSTSQETEEEEEKVTRILESAIISPHMLPPFAFPSLSVHDHSADQPSSVKLQKKRVDPSQLLYQAELNHWSGGKITPANNSPIQIPSAIAVAQSSSWGQKVSAGVVTATALIAQSAVSYASLLLCGLSNGRLAAYSVPWTGEPVDLVSVSLPLEKKDQDSIVLIKHAHLNCNQIVCKTKRGSVLVYQLNGCLCPESDSGVLKPTQAESKSWFTLPSFMKRKPGANNHQPSIALLFRIEPSDNIFALASLEDSVRASSQHRNAELLPVSAAVNGLGSPSLFPSSPTNELTNIAGNADGANVSSVSSIGTNLNPNRKKAVPVERVDLLPTAISFHASVSMLGSASSIMVGTHGGDIVKYNLDYSIGSFESPVHIPTPPFVSREFIHPSNAPSGFVLTAGVADKCGNKVFRELFHFHRAKIVSIDSVMRTSSYMISLDQAGRVAVWNYSPSTFEGKCWFKPSITAILSLKAKEFVPSSSPPPAAANATSAEEEGDAVIDKHGLFIRCREPTASLLSKLKVREVFDDAVNGDIIKWYSPIYSRSHEAWIQFRSKEKRPQLAPDYNTAYALLPLRPSSSNELGNVALKEEQDSADLVLILKEEHKSADLAPPLKEEPQEAPEAPETADRTKEKNKENLRQELEPNKSEESDQFRSFEKGLEETVAGDDEGEKEERISNLENSIELFPLDSAVSAPEHSNLFTTKTEAVKGEPMKLEKETEVQDLPLPRPVTPHSPPFNPVSVDITPVVEESNELAADISSLPATPEASPAPSLLVVAAEHLPSELRTSTPPPAAVIDDMKQEHISNLNPQLLPQLATQELIISRIVAEIVAVAVSRAMAQRFKSVFPETVFHKLKYLVESDPGKIEYSDPCKPAFNNEEIIDEGAVGDSDEAQEKGKKEKIKKKKEDLIEWRRGVYMMPKVTPMTILSSKMSLDGTELIILLCARTDSSNYQENSSNNQLEAVYYIIPYFILTNKFGQLYPRLCFAASGDASADDCVVDFAVGPICLETRSRMLFVLTKRAVRLFSSYSGREITTSSFPLLWELPDFTPTMVSVCPNNRILSLTSPDDARVAVFVLSHERDGVRDSSDVSISHQTLISAITSRLFAQHEPEELLLSLPAVGSRSSSDHAIQTVFNIVPEQPLERMSVLSDMKDIISALMTNVMNHIDAAYDERKRSKLILDIYEGDLGFIEPVSWPPVQSLKTSWMDLFPAVSNDINKNVDIPNTHSPARNKKSKNTRKKAKIKKELKG